MKSPLLLALLLALILTGFLHEGFRAEMQAIHQNFKTTLEGK